MSSSVAYARPISRPDVPGIAPAPTPVPSPAPRPVDRPDRRARPRATYAVITVASLAVIFAAQLLLSIAVTDSTYQISALQAEQKELVRQKDALAEKLNLLGSTQNLSANAAHLGMVPGSSPLFLDLSTGGVAAAPGSVDKGCGGACNLVANSLLTGMPLVSPQPPAATLGAEAGTTSPVTPEAPPVSVDAIPAPVTY